MHAWFAVFSTIHSRILLTEWASESLYSVQNIAIHRIRLILDSSNTLVYRLGPNIDISLHQINIHKAVVVFRITILVISYSKMTTANSTYIYIMKYFLFLSCESVNKYPYLHSRLGSLFLEVHELHNLSHDEALLEVRVYLARCLRGLRAFLQRHKTIYNCVLPNSSIR